MSNHYTGRAFIRVDGKEIPSLDGAVFTPGGVNRDVVKGSRVYGYRETAQESQVTLTIPHNSALSLFDLKDITDATVEFRTDTGRGFMMPNAWFAGTATLAANGDISATFMSVESKEI